MMRTKCKVLNGICIEQDRTQCKKKKQGCLGHPSAPRNASESVSLFPNEVTLGYDCQLASLPKHLGATPALLKWATLIWDRELTHLTVGLAGGKFCAVSKYVMSTAEIRAASIIRKETMRQVRDTYTPDGGPLKTYFCPFLVFS